MVEGGRTTPLRVARPPQLGVALATPLPLGVILPPPIAESKIEKKNRLVLGCGGTIFVEPRGGFDHPSHHRTAGLG